MREELLQSDIAFLSELRNWMRTSLDYSLCQQKPSGGDLVLMQESVMIGSRSFSKGNFVKLIDLVQVVEKNTPRESNYKIWLLKVNKNLNILSPVLDEVDFARVQEFFRIFHGINQIDGINILFSESEYMQARNA